MMKYLYLILTLFVISQLVGCVAPVLVAGAAGGAMVATDERGARTIIDDQIIESRAKDKIYSDPEVAKKIHINITSYNGVVLLSGEALNESLRTRAVDIVRYMDNVRRVYDEIRIANLSDLNSRTNDGLITSRVKTKMITTSGFKSSHVKITTEDGTVYLMGLVTRQTGHQAAEIARNISGVKRVVKLFEYTS